jgi:hypothetical protein
MLYLARMNTTIDSTTVSAPAGRTSDSNYAFAQVTLLSQLPNLTALKTNERKHMSKLGSKSRGFVDLAIEAERKDQGVLPRSLHPHARGAASAQAEIRSPGFGGARQGSHDDVGKAGHFSGIYSSNSLKDY